MKLNRWIGALGFALVMAAAGEGAEADPGKLARADCWFETPAKIAARCYHLNVPESRSGRSELTIELPVVVISVPAARKHDDPVIYLAGGPGDGAWLDADRIDFWWEFVADNAWLNERDLVLMDQRGTGMSTPRMDCREQETAQLRSLGFGLNRAAARQAWINAAAECRARVEKEGHDPLSYTSRDSATDLHDLMSALKLQQWNIYGLSYGTRLALTYVRDYPHDVRSLILDSVYLPESAFLEDDAWRTDRAFRVLFDGCRQDAECNGWYPDLENRLLALVERLNRTPIEREVELDSGQNIKVVVTGELLLNYLFQNLYNRSSIETVPQIIDLFEHGSESAITSEVGYLADLYVDRPDWGDALSLSVDCHEEVPFNDLAKLRREYERYPLLRSFAEDDAWGAACAKWPMGPPDTLENEPIYSDVPTLLLTGLYDPITPPQYARLAGSRLTNSFYFEFLSVGHDVLSNEPCAGELAKQFLEDPMRMPGHGCLGKLKPPEFRAPAR